MTSRAKRLGAPIGNKYAAHGHLAKHALMKALRVKSGFGDAKAGTDEYKVLVDIWLKQIDMALEGNNQSTQMIVERLDGKAAQSVDIKSESTQTTVHRIELVAPDISDSPLMKVLEHENQIIEGEALLDTKPIEPDQVMIKADTNSAND